MAQTRLAGSPCGMSTVQGHQAAADTTVRSSSHAAGVMLTHHRLHGGKAAQATNSDRRTGYIALSLALKTLSALGLAVSTVLALTPTVIGATESHKYLQCHTACTEQNTMRACHTACHTACAEQSILTAMPHGSSHHLQVVCRLSRLKKWHATAVDTEPLAIS